MSGARKFAKAVRMVAAVAVVAAAAAPQALDAMLHFRSYQEPVVHDHTTKTAILHWSRQIGKSHTLAGWSVNRLTKQLQTHDTWLVTVLSNSRANGGEFVLKCHDVCRKLGQAFTEDGNRAELEGRSDIAEDAKLELMRFEVRLEIGGKLGRIVVLAANPRTARGFSGDLILDEFAFHQDSRAIWDAAEPIISANPEFLLRISSTGNGRRNMFYQLIAEGRIPYYKVTRSDAWKLGELKIYSVITGREITPEQAEAEASDKKSYRQNYECEFNDESSALLTPDLISVAERVPIAVDEQAWSTSTIQRLWRAEGDLHAGQDVGRHRDLSVVTVLERIGNTKRVIAMLRMSAMRGPAQQRQLDVLFGLPKFRGICIDSTGLGIMLVDYVQELHGTDRCQGVNFATTEPVNAAIAANGGKNTTARVTELMASDLLAEFEARSIEIPQDIQLRDDLLKPEKIVRGDNRVSIAATRDEAGHADHFWSLALAIRAITALVTAYSATLI